MGIADDFRAAMRKIDEEPFELRPHRCVLPPIIETPGERARCGECGTLWHNQRGMIEPVRA